MAAGVDALGGGDDPDTVERRKGGWVIVPVFSGEGGGGTAPPYEKVSLPNVIVALRVEDIIVDEVRPCVRK